MVLTIKQTQALDYLEDKTTKAIIFGGGAGGSKSFLGAYWVIKSALKYEGTTWLVGRKEGKALRRTTLKTIFEVFKMQGIVKDIHYVYREQQGEINFFNGSQILLYDLAFQPSDPEYDILGSLELTGAFIDEVNQLPEIAWNIVKSRIRYKTKEYNLIPTILGTCNPSKNWVYKNYYKPEKEGTLDPTKKFIQALVTDNPYIDPNYIKNLNELPKAQRNRLLLGLWEADDDDQLCNQDAILSVFDNTWVGGSDYYITGDIARLGSDKAVIGVWQGFRLIDVSVYPKSKFDLLKDCITNYKNKYKVPNANIVLDEDGVGGFLVDALKCKGFLNNGRPFNNENYQNLKTQCYYKLAQMINSKELYITPDLFDTEETDKLIEELEQIKSAPTEDSKLKIISKTDVKNNIGRSPDIADMIMMRMYFTYKADGVYHI